MSHEAHHEEHSHGPEIDITKSKPAFTASFWFMLILACLFIAALNFVSVMSQPEEHGAHGGTHTEATHGGGHGAEATHEAHEAAPAAEPAHAEPAKEEEHAEHH